MSESDNYELENRLTVLENWKDAMQVEMVVRLMEQICNRINMNVGLHLPKVGKCFVELESLKLQFEKKCEDDIQDKKEIQDLGSNSIEELKNLKVAVN